MANISLRNYLKRIDTLIEENRLGEAITNCRHILKQHPRHLETYRLLGKAYLEQGNHGDATDIFQRILSVDPEDFIAHVGLAIINKDNGLIPEALWQMERAFELDPYNVAIQQELRGLYRVGNRAIPERWQLSRGAIARLYMKGEFYQQAMTELRQELNQDETRIDLKVLLAEALWRNDQRVDAVELCRQILDTLPYCLKANAILAEVWLLTGRIEEAQEYLSRLQSLLLFDQIYRDSDTPAGRAFRTEGATPLPPEITIEELAENAFTVQAPGWVDEVNTATELSAIPDWLLALEEQDKPETSTSPLPTTKAEPVPAPPTSDQVARPAEPNDLSEDFSWLSDVLEPEEPPPPPPPAPPTATEPEPPAKQEQIEQLTTSLQSGWTDWLTPPTQEEPSEPISQQGSWTDWLTPQKQEPSKPPNQQGSWTDWLNPSEKKEVTPTDDSFDWFSPAPAEPAPTDNAGWFEDTVAFAQWEDKNHPNPAGTNDTPNWLLPDDQDPPDNDFVWINEPQTIDQNPPNHPAPQWEEQTMGLQNERSHGPANDKNKSADMENLSWLDELAAVANAANSQTGSQPQNELPDWLKTDFDTPADSESLDWLQELQAASEPSPTPLPPERDEMADWLAENVPTNLEENDLSWLDQIAAGQREGIEDMPTQSWTEPAKVSEVDWLSELGQPTTAGRQTPFESEMPTATFDVPASEPDWLSEFAAQPKAPGRDMAYDQSNDNADEALAWLEQLAAQQEQELAITETAPAPPKATMADMDWLAELAAQSPEPAGDWLTNVQIEPEPAEEFDDSLPEETEAIDWLAELTEQPQERAGDWLAEMQQELPPAQEPETVDWLAEFTKQPQESVATDDWLTAPAGYDQAPDDLDEAMNWLEQLAAQQGVPAEELPSLQAEEATPAGTDWLQPQESVATDDWLTAPAGTGYNEAPDDLDEAMAWLEQLAAQQGVPTEELPSLQAEEATPAGTDWLQPQESVATDDWLTAPAGYDQAPDDLDEAMAWLEQLAAQQGVPAEELPSLQAEETAPAGTDWLQPQESVATDDWLTAPPGYDQAPEDLNEAMAWLEQLAAQQGVPAEELPSLQAEETAPAGTDWLQPQESVATDDWLTAPAGTSYNQAPDDLDAAMAWLEQLAAQQGTPLEELPSLQAEEATPPHLPTQLGLWDADADAALLADMPEDPAAAMVWLEHFAEADEHPARSSIDLPEPQVDDALKMTVGEAPDDLDAAMAWLEQLAAQQGTPLEELPSMAAPAGVIFEPPTPAAPQRVEEPVADFGDFGEAPDDLDAAMAWLEQLAAQQGTPLEELPSMAAPAGVIFEPPTPAAPQRVEEPVADFTDFGEAPDDLDAAMAWLEQLAAQQGTPLEELPSMAAPAGVVFEPPTPAAPQRVEEPVADFTDFGEAPDDLDAAMAWLEQLAAQQGTPLEELPSMAAPAGVIFEPPTPAAPQRVEEPVADFADFGEAPDDLDAAMAWLEQLAAQQGTPLEELPSMAAPATPQRVEEPVADFGEAPDDLDAAMAWLEQLAAQQGTPLEELPSMAAPAGVIFEPPTPAAPQRVEEPVADFGEVPDDLDAAMAWLEQLAAQQGTPLEELPSMAAPAGVIFEPPTPAAPQRVEEPVADFTDFGEAPDDLDAAMAWLEQLAAQQGTPLEELPSMAAPAGVIFEPPTPAAPQRVEEPVADFGEVPDDLDAAMAWLEQLAAQQGTPLEELPSMAAPAGVIFEPPTPAAPQRVEEPVADFTDFGEAPDDLDAAMAWLEQLAAQQGTPLEELPSMATPAGVIFEPPTPAAPQRVEEPVADFGEAPDDLDAAMAWLEQLAAQQGTPLEELPSMAAPAGVIFEPPTPAAPQRVEEPVADFTDFGEAPDDLDAAMAWLEQLAAQQGTPLEELPSMAAPAGVIFEPPTPAAPQRVEEPVADFTDFGEAPDDLDAAMAWLEQLAAQQGTPLEELPSMAAPAGVIFEPPTPAAPQRVEEPVADFGEVPDDLDAAMAWLEQLAAQQGTPLEELPSMAAPAGVIFEPPTPAAPQRVEEPVADFADFGEAPDDLDAAMAWLEQLAAQQGTPLEELPSMAAPAGVVFEPPTPAAPQRVEEPVADFADFGEAPDDLDAAMAWLEQLAAQQGTPLEELPSITTEQAVRFSPPSQPTSKETYEAIPEDPDEAMAWLEQLAAQQGTPLDELTLISQFDEQPSMPDWLSYETSESELSIPAGIPIESEMFPSLIPTTEELDDLNWMFSEAPAGERPSLLEPLPDLDQGIRDSLPDWFSLESTEAAAPPALSWASSDSGVTGWLVAEEEMTGRPAVPAPVRETKSPEPVVSAPLRPDIPVPAADPGSLSVARQSLRTGNYDTAFQIYEQLLEAEQSLPMIIADLEGATAGKSAHPVLNRLLGDAYMQNGQLQKALESYRQALDLL